MEIILWIVGIALGVVLLKFIYCFILQLIGPGLVFAFMSLIVCGIMALLDIMEYLLCCCEVGFLYWFCRWSYYVYLPSDQHFIKGF